MSNKTKHDLATSKKQLKQQPKLINSLSFGDILQNKDQSVTRFLYQNTRSLERSTYSHTLETFCNAMYEHDVTVGCLAETNTHWRHPQTRKRLLKVKSQFGNAYTHQPLKLSPHGLRFINQKGISQYPTSSYPQ